MHAARRTRLALVALLSLALPACDVFLQDYVARFEVLGAAELTFSADGQELWTGSSLWSRTDWSETRVPFPRYAPASESFFYRDGSDELAVFRCERDELEAFGCARATSIQLDLDMLPEAEILDFEPSPDGTRLAVRYTYRQPPNFWLWQVADTSDSRVMCSFQATPRVFHVPGREQLVAAYPEEIEGQVKHRVRLHDLTTCELVGELAIVPEDAGLSVSPDGASLAIFDDDLVTVVDLDSLQPLATRAPTSYRIARWTADSRFLLIGDTFRLEAWRATDLGTAASLSFGQPDPYDQHFDAAVPADGEIIAVATDDSDAQGTVTQVTIWPLELPP